VVRQRFLVSCTVGSNPTAPAIFSKLIIFLKGGGSASRQLIAVVFGDDEGRVVDVIDLLAQAIDMGFQRMG
jgi:hypothetical protein